MSAGGGRKKKKHAAHEEEHENHERWLVTYADMLTLLMVLFIVLFALGQVDQKKYEQFAAGMAVALGGVQTVSLGASGPTNSEDKSGEDAQPMDAGAGSPGEKKDAELQKKIKRAVSIADLARASSRAQAAEREVENFRKVQKNIEDALTRQNAKNGVRFKIDERGLVVTVVTDSVVFHSADATLQPAGQKIIDAITPQLTGLPNKIQVDGHTNSLPIHSSQYPSNWELSTARASVVVRRMITKGLGADRVSAVGYADKRPLYGPKDERAVELNRRVEIVVLSDQSSEVKALLPSAAGETAESGTKSTESTGSTTGTQSGTAAHTTGGH